LVSLIDVSALGITRRSNRSLMPAQANEQLKQKQSRKLDSVADNQDQPPARVAKTQHSSSAQTASSY
jgi:hypothetical protein